MNQSIDGLIFNSYLLKIKIVFKNFFLFDKNNLWNITRISSLKNDENG